MPTTEEPPPVPVTPPASASEELMDLEEFSIGGLGGVGEQESPAQDLPAVMASAGADAGEPPDLGFNLGEEEGPFEADPFAIAAQPASTFSEPEREPEPEPEAVADAVPQPDVELAADLEIGLPDDSPAPAESVDAASIDERFLETVAGHAAETELLGGLETFESGLPEASSVEVPALDVVAFDATPLSTAAVPSAPIDGGHAGDEVPPEPAVEPEPAEAFVTETMAELYLQQGHLESAIDIYRKLVDARPDDAGLRERMRAAEARLYGAPESIDEPVAEPVIAGPTIREFLQSLVRPPMAAAAEPMLVESDAMSSTPESGIEESPELESAPAPEWTAEQEPAIDDAAEEWAAPDVPRPTPAAGETVSGSIDALFSGAEASSHDSAAASALAEAFAPEGPETAPLHGVPAHRASSELSLDHVFKSGTPPRGENADAFSFDQFFAEEVTQGPASTDAEPGAAPREAPDDIAQFNAWLNGLKKT
ncbi:MAG TPA: hypothetical protein VHB25_15435, partial [Gemmatimonadaceae bacterium]|nr:hypothetical protein [Gemmatimonadaceae bacterium]